MGAPRAHSRSWKSPLTAVAVAPSAHISTASKKYISFSPRRLHRGSEVGGRPYTDLRENPPTPAGVPISPKYNSPVGRGHHARDALKKSTDMHKRTSRPRHRRFCAHCHGEKREKEALARRDSEVYRHTPQPPLRESKSLKKLKSCPTF